MSLVAGLLVGVLGLAGALVASRRLRRRLEAVAWAEHELRGPATALLLATERLAREPAGARSSAVLVAQLDRLLAGLDDLEAARTGRRPAGHRDVVDLREYTRSTLAAWEGSVQASVDWWTGPERVAVDRGRLAQALGNLIANAAEHGAGEVRIEGRRGASGLRLEVSNAHRPDAGSAGRPARGRGRGLRIAAGAARDLGGRLRVESGERATLAVLELPDEAAARSRDRAA